jgi:hypothetical protein
MEKLLKTNLKMIKMKKCKKCNNEFEPRGNKGSEQIYCSQDCRQKAGIERYKQRLINLNNNNNENKSSNERINGYETKFGFNENGNENTNFHGSNETNVRSMEFEQRGLNGRMGQFNNIGPGRSYEYNSNLNEYIELIKENANLRAEIKLLIEKNTNLEAELLEYELEEDMQEEEQPGFLGNIMNAYKQDPTTTVLFAKDMVLEFLKPKQQTTTKTQQ